MYLEKEEEEEEIGWQVASYHLFTSCTELPESYLTIYEMLSVIPWKDGWMDGW